jgi:hypothetical protein
VQRQAKLGGRDLLVYFGTGSYDFGTAIPSLSAIIAMASDEDDGNFHPGITGSPLQIKPTQSRQPHVEDQAAGHIWTLAPQKLLSRGEELDPQPSFRVPVAPAE